MKIIQNKLIMRWEEVKFLQDSLILADSLNELAPDGIAEGVSGHEIAWGRKMLRIELPEHVETFEKEEGGE